MTNPLQKKLVPELQRICIELDNLAQQATAHRHKFQYAFTQFREFVDKFAEHATDDPVSRDQIQAYKMIIQAAQEYESLIGQNMAQNWAQTAIESHSSQIASELCAIASKLKEVTAVIDPVACNCFNPGAQQWVQYHILDLRSIYTSFSQYKPSENDPVEPLLRQRTKSIENFLKRYEAEALAQGQRNLSPIPVNYQSWRISHDIIERIREVGSGISAIVFYGRDKRTGQEVAIKRLKAKKLVGAKLQAFQRELAILATAQHPTLLKFIGATDTPPYCILTEWMPGNSVYHDLHKYHKLNETQRTFVCFDVARGMKFLHSRQIIHRDLKTLNILIDKDGFSRICDFGASRTVGQGDLLTKNIGTPHWMAPELLESGQNYDNKIDVYAYAITCWEILTAQLPYQGLDPTQIIAQVLVQNMRPPIPDNCPEAFKDLITACWDRDPKRRPTFAQIVHAFKSGKIYIPGTDLQKLREYLDQVFQEEPDEIEDEIKEDQIEESKKEESAEEFIELLEKEGIPTSSNLLEKCWNRFNSFDWKAKPKLYVKGAVLFLSTHYKVKIATSLRNLPVNSVDREDVKKAISVVPTGNDSIDLELIIFACKNGCSDQAAIHSFQNEHCKLALEACAKCGVPQESVEAVSNRCVSSLSSVDPMLVVAAIRCLIKIKEAKKIPVEIIKMHMLSKNKTLYLASYVAAAAMADEGAELPLDLIDAQTSKWITDQLATTVVLSGCKHINVSTHMLSRLAFGAGAPPEIAIRILMMASQHQQLKSQVIEGIEALKKKQISPDIAKAADRLMAKCQSS
ncbi:TKL family protein kinase [Histomonas meleagridis]|uniref:TKL family protein kinase n=1 Tax=Histomonas meleagridis TaxID=135588 RepID=UPI003559892D|nr:TKL family protein kinase [Histomonas meleagridis]KAH0798122.1 TKL family protein kinase [Histomonas meleagridis]